MFYLVTCFYVNEGLDLTKSKFSPMLTNVSRLPAAINISETVHSADKYVHLLYQSCKCTIQKH